MFRITSTIFNEIEEITNNELIELYENGTLEELAYFFTNVLSNEKNDRGDSVYLDLTHDELMQDWLDGEHRLMKIKGNSLLYNALGYVYDTYDEKEIAKLNGSLAMDDQGDLYFFTGWNYDFINELLKDVDGRQGFLNRLNEER